jgi:hypothetical protein
MIGLIPLYEEVCICTNDMPLYRVLNKAFPHVYSGTNRTYAETFVVCFIASPCFPYYPYPCLRQAHANGVYTVCGVEYMPESNVSLYTSFWHGHLEIADSFLCPNWEISCYFFKNDINIIRKRVLRMSYSDAFTITLFIYLFGVRLWIGSLFSNVCREDWRTYEPKGKRKYVFV